MSPTVHHGFVFLPLLLLVHTAAGISAQEVVAVRAGNAPVWGDAPLLREEVRIGVVDGDDRYILGHVVGVAVAADGTLWVADSQRGAMLRARAST